MTKQQQGSNAVAKSNYQLETIPNVTEKVWHWLDVLEPLNKKPTIGQKLEAHIELKQFIQMLVGQPE